jgi:8-oxo-dGTP pyrophosphatase MutT (NUDIX family)
MAEPEAAVCIVHTRGPEESILLIRRAEREGDSWSGQWSLPGGRRDDGDIDLLHTSLRELEEECGIRLRREDLESALPHRLARRRVGPYLLVAPFVFRVDTELATILDPLEAAHAEWVPLDYLRDLDRHCLRSVPGVPSQTLFPGVELEGAPLWGFTYRLLCDWLGLPAGGRPADAILQFLLERGLTLAREWSGRVAEVRGTIPVEDVLARFCSPGPQALSINRLEVRADFIRLLGPDFEEYVIRESSALPSSP